MTKIHPEINRDLLSNLRCYLAPKTNQRKTKFETDSFDICANFGASYCAKPDEIDLITGTYKNLTVVSINVISEGLKFAG